MNHDGSAVAPGLPGSSLYPKSPLGEQVEGVPTGRDVDCLLYTSDAADDP